MIESLDMDHISAVRHPSAIQEQSREEPKRGRAPVRDDDGVNVVWQDRGRVPCRYNCYPQPRFAESQDERLGIRFYSTWSVCPWIDRADEDDIKRATDS